VCRGGSAPRRCREWIERRVAFGFGDLDRLAVPLVFAASLLRAGQGTVFVGLAFNMLFAVLARPVDLSPGTAPGMIANEAMLLAGIALNFTFYRWLLPMDTGRRRRHLRAAIRREIGAISIRSGTP
jgi:hypothetical protein